MGCWAGQEQLAAEPSVAVRAGRPTCSTVMAAAADTKRASDCLRVADVRGKGALKGLVPAAGGGAAASCCWTVIAIAVQAASLERKLNRPAWGRPSWHFGGFAQSRLQAGLRTRIAAA